MGCGDFVKVEIMRDAKYLFPDNYETIKATEILAKEGFVVLPYMNPDLNVARDLQNAGAAAVMPLAAPIGSNKGLATKAMIQVLIDEIDLPVIVDAGIGKPSQACEAMEMGAAAIMANTAIATAGDVPEMAAAFKTGDRSRTKGISDRNGKSTCQRWKRIRSADRIFTLGGSRSMNEENQVYFVDSDQLPPAALERKHRLEQDPSFRTNHMEYMKGMQVIEIGYQGKGARSHGCIRLRCLHSCRMWSGRFRNESCSIEDFKALLSPAAAAISGADGEKSGGDHEKSFWKYGLYFYTALHRQLLSELLHLLRI